MRWRGCTGRPSSSSAIFERPSTASSLASTRFALEAVARLSVLIEEANAIANGEEIPGAAEDDANGEANSQAAIDALFDAQKGA